MLLQYGNFFIPGYFANAMPSKNEQNVKVQSMGFVVFGYEYWVQCLRPDDQVKHKTGRWNYMYVPSKVSDLHSFRSLKLIGIIDKETPVNIKMRATIAIFEYDIRREKHFNQWRLAGGPMVV